MNAATPLSVSPVQTMPAYFPTIGTAFTTNQILLAALGLVFLIWLIYTLVVTYHWTKYGHQASISLPSLAVHVFISVGLFILALSAFA